MFILLRRQEIFFLSSKSFTTEREGNKDGDEVALIGPDEIWERADDCVFQTLPVMKKDDTLAPTLKRIGNTAMKIRPDTLNRSTNYC